MGGFRDPDLPLADRLDDLLGRLTLDEKVALMHQHQPAIPRLGIAAYRTGTEALHGVAWLGPATVFPQAVGLASTWSPALVRRVGSAVGDEARGFHARDPESTGLNVWAPVVNPLRDPRWGRNEEGYSEDPLLTGVMATAYARGLRGDHPFYLRTAPTLKHFLAYNQETDRATVSVAVRPRVLHEYELPAFRPALAAGAATGIMPSYNLVNGRPAHLSPLIAEVRGWSAHELLVVSDAFAPSNIAGVQGYLPGHPEAHAAAVRAGVDSFTDQGADPSLTIDSLRAALRRGLLAEADVDRAARRILSIRFRLGEFDPAGRNPFARIGAEAIGARRHRTLAREAARQAIVLLKNDGPLLPLRPGETRRVAVVGPLADTLYTDWYSGTLPYEITPLRGIRERVDAVCHEGADRVALRVPGGAAQAFDVFDWGGGVCALRSAANGRYLALDEDGALVSESVRPGGWVVREAFRLGPAGLEHVATARRVDASVELLGSGAEAAAEAARRADTAIVVVGNCPAINGRETEDRADIALPPAQERLVRAVLAANPRTVLMVVSSYPMAIAWADAHVPAILWSSHGGQELGQALADVLFGAHAPAGRLTQTWYRSGADLPELSDYDIIGSRRTYRYFEGTPLYPFGHGLTYAPFRYANLRRSRSSVRIEVTNTGEVASDEVVQLYTRSLAPRAVQPRRQLRGFRRLHLRPGQTRAVRFRLRAADLATWDVTRGRFAVEAGAHEVMVGRSSAAIELRTVLHVRGETIPPRDATAEIRAADFDDHRGTTLVDETRARGDAVAPAARGAWIAFRGVDFGPGAGQVVARVSRSRLGEAAIRLRVDGRPIGRLRVPSTGDRYDWATVSAPVRAPAGVHDLVVGFDGQANLASLRFTSS